MSYQIMPIINDRGRPPRAKSAPSSFGTWLKDQRVKRGWSSERMSEELGLSQGAVSLYERGARHPKREKVVQIAIALGANPQEALDALIADTPGLTAITGSPHSRAEDIALLDRLTEDQYQRLVRPLLEELAGKNERTQ